MGLNYDKMQKELNSLAENTCLNLGLDSVQILATSNSNSDCVTVEHEAGYGSLLARVGQARNFVMRQDTYVKRNAWDETYNDDEEEL